MAPTPGARCAAQRGHHRLAVQPGQPSGWYLGLRCRQEGARAQAPSGRGHTGPAACGGDHQCSRAGPRRGRASGSTGVQAHGWLVQDVVGRQRVRWAMRPADREGAPRTGAHRAPQCPPPLGRCPAAAVERRAARPHRQEALGGGAHPCMAGAQPQACDAPRPQAVLCGCVGCGLRTPGCCWGGCNRFLLHPLGDAKEGGCAPGATSRPSSSIKDRFIKRSDP
uniref:Uncharacterized protein n=1 Tax=Hyaloperonospora arabidopsidis (strain Emoy2) TaxID=559515 RepID=M4C703_HYAAE